MIDQHNNGGRGKDAPALSLDREFPFPEELRRLAEVKTRLDAALAEAEAEVGELDRDYREEKRYMAQYRGELDPHEMFQNELALGQLDRRGALAAGARDRLLKLRDSPYFARIDFRGAGEREAEPCYIGSFSFSHQNEILVFDWRSPLAGMFYDCEVGPAGYEAPAGRVQGEVTRKRQFRIRRGRMEYALESSVNIQDDVLQRELAHTSDEKMKSIISTIQKEQNRIIRSEGAGTLVIQGSAGSGKTSIALHRIAFLLYRQRGRLAAQNVVILSPNKVFGDYISDVLPELGEEPVSELSFEDIARVQLEGTGVDLEPERDPLEVRDGAWLERARRRSTLGFLEELDRFIARMPDFILEPRDCAWGRFGAGAEEIQKKFAALGGFPIKRRLELIAEDLHDRFATRNVMGDPVPGARTILKALSAMVRFRSPLALYREFIRQWGDPGGLVTPQKNTLEWADVYPFLYLKGAYDGLRKSGVIRHLVVDEMQDYTPVQYAVLNLLFPCPKTILGDFTQQVHPARQGALEDLRRLCPGAEFVELTKSYRSTWEIMSFAKRVGDAPALEPVARHGEAPEVLCCRDRGEELAQIERIMEEFAQSGCATLGIITKTDREAGALYEALPRRAGVGLLTPESASFQKGVLVASARLSKGLEFDWVVVPGADRRNYAAGYERGLLYVACTRAMHRLWLTHTGEPSPFLP